jgi:uncharacterized membrane protein YcaP (DUF421 family)
VKAWKIDPIHANPTSMASVLRAVFGYAFLVFMVRVVGRRPGKQMTPFEFVLIFFIGGLTLTFVVGDEASFTNALGQIMTIAILHYLISWARTKSSAFARLTDGTPLVLLEKGQWRSIAMKGMRIADDDVMAAARDKEIKTLDEIEYAILERNGEISIIEVPQSS